MFADNTYSKPYLVTYINTAFFILPLIPILIHRAYHDPAPLRSLARSWRQRIASYTPLQTEEEDEGILKPDSPHIHPRRRSHSSLSGELLISDSLPHLPPHPANPSESRLSIRATAALSLEFCLLWFLANYFIAGCLEHTTVASSTILTSTSSIFTLIFGALFGVETFTLRKCLGVCASLAGIILISSVDLSGNNDSNRGSFPHKTRSQIALGDAMALVSAVLYGVYAVFLKRRVGDETRVNMPLFFGLVGLANVLLLWPGFIVLHFTGVERFELPPTGRVAAIVLVNSVSSLVSDIAWAYAVLLTSPIVVTVGLSTTIPLSLVGQIVLNGQTAPAVYWVGAGVVVLSFVFINHEEEAEEQPQFGVLREEGTVDG